MRWAKEPPVSIVSFGKLRVIAIFCCFGYVIYNANDKLQSGTIGTTLNTVNSKLVQESVTLTLLINQKVCLFLKLLQFLLPIF